MKIQQFLFVVLVLLSAPLIALLISISQSSWSEYAQVKRSASLARATASWIDGQVALSLERSLSQVAFAVELEERSVFTQSLETQRRIVDQHFSATFYEINQSFDTLDLRLESFQRLAKKMQHALKSTRQDIDAKLLTTGICYQGCQPLIKQLIAIIDQTAAIRASLETPTSQISANSYDSFQLQHLAWQAREFAGRVRTPYVIATMYLRAIPEPEKSIIQEHLRLGIQTWDTLGNVAQRLDPDSSIFKAYIRADAAYYKQHTLLLSQIDAAFDTEDFAQIPSYDAFFDTSSTALAAISGVATVSGQEIQSYWRKRQAKSLTIFWSTAIASTTALASLIVIIATLRRHLVLPVLYTTNLLSRLASGDLHVKRKKPVSLMLTEIKLLDNVVERFREELLQTQIAEKDARTDHLTKLPNRRDMEERLSVNSQTPFRDGDAFVYIDLDEFKPINDAFGHSAGDKVLQEVAERLKRFAPDTSELWRLGGDEYGFVIRNAASPEHLSFIADSLFDIVSAPIAFEGKELFIGVSIGVAIHDDAVLNPQDMFARADVAMFTAKNNPHKNFEIYGSSLQTRRYGNEVRRDVIAALEDGAIFPVFQPQIDLNTGEIIGFEALARWRRPDGEVSSPAEFMDIVEYFGSQSELDILIAARTIEVMRDIHKQGILKPRFSINVSERSLSSREVRDGYLSLFERNDELVSQITVEVTENALLDRSAQAIRSSLQSFSTAGVALSMDDFGTGYGSFRHLQEYSFDEIKIDKSFVAKLLSDHSSEVIISGFLHIAKGLNASVVAEGVETEEQKHKLTELGCQYGQGYLFAKPVCAEDVPGFLEHGSLLKSG